MVDEHERQVQTNFAPEGDPDTVNLTRAEYSRLMKVDECWSKLDEDQLMLGRILKNAIAENLSIHRFPLATKKEEQFCVGGYFAATLQHAYGKYKKARNESD